MAVANGQEEVVAFLLSRPELDVNRRDTYTVDPNNPFLQSAQLNARHAAFPHLNAETPAADPDEDGEDAGGYTALHYAALCGSLAVVEQLLAAGADPELKAHGFAPGELDLTRMPEGPDKQRWSSIAERLTAERGKRGAERERAEKEERLRFPLEGKLSRDMIAQEVPILSVASAIRRRENGWHSAEKPLVFLFLGSSGVGQKHHRTS